MALIKDGKLVADTFADAAAAAAIPPTGAVIVSLEQWQAAFANSSAARGSLDQFKLKALDNMSATIGTLETEVAKSRAYLERVAQQDTRASALPSISIDR